MAYRAGPYFSPELYRKTILPALLDGGFTALNPLEVKAGHNFNNVRELKETYADELVFWGNIDVRILSSTNLRDIRREAISRISVAGNGGGYIICRDHQVPPTVSLRNIEFFLKTAEKHVHSPLNSPHSKGLDAE